MRRRKKSRIVVRIGGSAESAGTFGTFKSLSEYALIPGEMKKENAEAMCLYTLDHLRKDLMKVGDEVAFVLF